MTSPIAFGTHRSEAELRPTFISSNSKQQHTALIAQLMQGAAAPLFQSFAKQPNLSLRENYKTLPQQTQQRLQQKWGPKLNHWLSLADETNSRLFHQGLSRLIQKLENEGRYSEAISLYQTLSRSDDLPKALQEKFQKQLLALSGKGGFGENAEFWTNQLCQSLIDPAIIVPMAIGGITFRAGRLLGLRYLPNIGLTGYSIRPLATLGGLATETLAFTGSAKSIRSLMGHSENWSVNHLISETTATALVLGSLRFVGNTTRYLSATSPWKKTYHQIGMYGGIVLGHGLQAHFGLRPYQNPLDLLSESLAMLIQFNFGGLVARATLGRHFTKLEQQLEYRMHTFEATAHQPQKLFNQLGEINPTLRPALVGVEGHAKRNTSPSQKLFNHMTLMTSSKNPSSKPQVLLSPYSTKPNSREFHIAKPEQTVVVLGDVGAARTLELAKLGHHPIHIDKSEMYFLMSRRLFERHAEKFYRNTGVDVEVNAEWILGDWFEVQSKADLVEAYYPLGPRDLSTNPNMQSVYTRKLMHDAFHTKLKAGGHVFVISEESELIRYINQEVESNPQLHMVTRNTIPGAPPIRGGYNAYTNAFSKINNYWIIYRYKASEH